MGQNQAREAEPEDNFEATKALTSKDELLVDMLNSTESSGLCWCITDPDQNDNPIVYASVGFCNFTGYAQEEIHGRNCRFLQGPETDQKDVAVIRNAIKDARETNVCLLNYRKNGTTFVNQFFVSPLRNANGKVCYYLGVQVAVDKLASGQQPSNAGWVYSMGLRDDLAHPPQGPE